MKDAVIFIHRGHAGVLPYVLSQARKWNPKVPMFLIGDQKNLHYRFGIRHVSLKRFMQDANRFAGFYQHLSPNPVSYELFCFQRWFALAEFVRTMGIEHVVHLDSDVLAYCDLVADYRYYVDADCAFYLPPQRSIGIGHVGHFRAKSLDAFCEFCFDLYRQPGNPKRLAELRHTPEYGSSISDMVALGLFAAESGVRVADTGQVIEGARHDSQIKTDDGCEMCGDHKAITWRDGRPYAKPPDGDEVRYKTLHFQGIHKRLIPEYSTAKGYPLLPMLCFERAISSAVRVKQSIRRAVSRG